MNREEAIKWLKIKRECYDYEGMSCEKPMDAGLKIGCGYCEEAIDMAIEALKDRPQGEWVDNGIEGSNLSKCTVCGFDVGALPLTTVQTAVQI